MNRDYDNNSNESDGGQTGGIPDAETPRGERDNITDQNPGGDCSPHPYFWSYTDYLNSSSQNEPREIPVRNNRLRNYAIAATVLLLISITMLLTMLLFNYTSSGSILGGGGRTIFIREYDSESGYLTIPEIAELLKPSVVGIAVKGPRGQSVGTGIVMSADGYIATNQHVVDGGTSFLVIMQDGSEHDAELIGADELSDLAVIKIDYDKCSPAKFGDSDALIVGEGVVAIGTPAGLEFAGTVTEGIISAINRDVRFYDDYTGILQKKMTLIQTNAQINSGNSGGPLINYFGEVIGINTLKLADGYDGIGFALPINGALEILNLIIKQGGISEQPGGSFVSLRPLIGITGQVIDAATAAEIGVSGGVLVVSVNPDYDAYAAGLSEGDIIIAVDNYAVRSTGDINAVLERKRPGDKVALEIVRGNHRIVLDIMLGS